MHVLSKIKLWYHASVNLYMLGWVHKWIDGWWKSDYWKYLQLFYSFVCHAKYISNIITHTTYSDQTIEVSYYISYVVFPTVYGKSNLVMKIKLPNVYCLLKHHDTIWFNRGGLIKREENTITKMWRAFSN